MPRQPEQQCLWFASPVRSGRVPLSKALMRVGRSLGLGRYQRVRRHRELTFTDEEIRQIRDAIDATRPSTPHLELRAAEWAAQLVDERGWRPDTALAHARAAYSLPGGRQAGAEASLTAEFRAALVRQIATRREGGAMPPDAGLELVQAGSLYSRSRKSRAAKLRAVPHDEVPMPAERLGVSDYAHSRRSRDVKRRAAR